MRLAERTDFLTMHAEALVDLGRGAAPGGRDDEADAALAQALELYQRKGDVVFARARAREGR